MKEKKKRRNKIYGSYNIIKNFVFSMIYQKSQQKLHQQMEMHQQEQDYQQEQHYQQELLHYRELQHQHDQYGKNEKASGIFRNLRP